MVLSPEELNVLHGMMSAAGNVTSYGYDVAVRGTVISGISDLICSGIALIVAVAFLYRFVNWVRTSEGVDGEDKAVAYVMGVVLAFVIFGVVAIMVDCTIGSALMKIYAPEYIVINKIMEAATTAAS